MDREIAADVVALVPAAGGGTRLGLGPKAFVQLNGRTLLGRVTDTLLHCVGRVIVGVPPQMIDEARRNVAATVEVHPGGSTRSRTIGMLSAQCREPLVLVHDVACPFASGAVILAVIQQARAHDAAAAYLPPGVPASLLDSGFLTQCLPKSRSALVRCPLAFRQEVFGRILARAQADQSADLSLIELCALEGIRVRAVPCEETNIKITTPLDWQIAVNVIAAAADADERRKTSEGG